MRSANQWVAQLGKIAGDIVGSKQHFQSAATADEPWQARHGSTAGHQTGSDFPLREDGFFTAGEANIARQRQFTADACGAAANGGNGDNG